jgi:hypothetical protein
MKEANEPSIFPSDAIEISKSLPYVKSLMRLDLRNNPLITIEGYASLAEAMKRNHTLAFLDIDVSVSSVLWMLV